MMKGALARIFSTKVFLVLSTVLFLVVIALTLYLAVETPTMRSSVRIVSSNTTLFTEKSPSPSMSAREVVETQLLLLRHNDGFDEGIWGAYKFMRNYYEEVPDGYKSFVALMHSDKFNPLMSFRSMHVDDTDFYKNRAFQMVRLETGVRSDVVYLFELIRHDDKPARDCWLVTGIRKISGGDDLHVI